MRNFIRTNREEIYKTICSLLSRVKGYLYGMIGNQFLKFLNVFLNYLNHFPDFIPKILNHFLNINIVTHTMVGLNPIGLVMIF